MRILIHIITRLDEGSNKLYFPIHDIKHGRQKRSSFGCLTFLPNAKTGPLVVFELLPFPQEYDLKLNTPCFGGEQWQDGQNSFTIYCHLSNGNILEYEPSRELYKLKYLK